MPVDYPQIAALAAQARDNPAWRWYAIADSAQNKALPAALSDGEGQLACLLGATQGSPLAEQSPHLVQLPSPARGGAAWQWIGQMATRQPCLTVLASRLPFDPLFEQLKQFTEIRLPDGEEMFFAFWDPAILGTLMGQEDDATLYVRGPVLEPEQRRALCGGLQGWWYWDREAAMHAIMVDPAAAPQRLPGPLPLTQAQVDALVEASVPDHVLYFVDLNQPQLLADLRPEERYGFVMRAVAGARDIGLEKMGDLTNYVCAALIYGQRWQHDNVIGDLLARVKSGGLEFSHALEMLP